LPLQTVLSAHDVPFGSGLAVQPKTGSQPSVVHGLPSLQVSGVPAVQVPAWQVSLPLHRLPSVHDVPLGREGCWHPVTGLQLSVVHALPSLQTRGVPPAQKPLWQVSSPLQTLPSVHDEPSASAVCWQPATGSQLSVVHEFESPQARGAPAVHEPLWQVSLPLQTLPSAHDEPFGRAGLLHAPPEHTSLVQGLPSAHSAATAQG
jgi:hypothetical protein